MSKDSVARFMMECFERAFLAVVVSTIVFPIAFLAWNHCISELAAWPQCTLAQAWWSVCLIELFTKQRKPRVAPDP